MTEPRDPGPPFTAEYSSICGRCHDPIQAGEKIQWVGLDYKYGHVVCPDPLPKPVGDLCQRCFMVPCFCDDEMR